MSNNETSSPPTPSIDSSSISNQNQKSRLEILSSSTGYVSLLETSENPDSTDSSSTIRSTLSLTRTLGTLRQWTWKTFETTRQFFQEKFGLHHRTMDPELEQQIQTLEESRRHYHTILTQAKQLSIHFTAIIQLQKDFSESLNDIQRFSLSSDDLTDTIVRNSQCQKMLANHGDPLLKCLNHFIDRLQILVYATMDDLFRTVKVYETARYEYDSLRGDYDLIPNTNPNEIVNPSVVLSSSGKDHQGEEKCRQSRQRYERAKDDLNIKLKLLEQYRIQLLRQELMNLHQSIGTYFSLNRQQLNF